MGGLESETGQHILFEAGSEFVVCKVEQTNDVIDGNKSATVTNIYLRNVQLGLSSQTTMLQTDDQIF